MSDLRNMVKPKVEVPGSNLSLTHFSRHYYVKEAVTTLMLFASSLSVLFMEESYHLFVLKKEMNFIALQNTPKSFLNSS
jgi:hypothetical protein